MTLDPEKDEYAKPKQKFSGRKRKERAIRRNHKRELAALEYKLSMGAGLTSAENARLGLLREMYG